jgi:hypothetical protein
MLDVAGLRRLIAEEPTMASFKVEGSTEPLRPPEPGTANSEEPVKPRDTADPYEAAVERLFVLLEENQVAMAILAQAWRHMRRALELTQAELSRTQDALAAERGAHRQSAWAAPWAIVAGQVRAGASRGIVDPAAQMFAEARWHLLLGWGRVGPGACRWLEQLD